MRLMYGVVNGNSRAALRLYQERFPSRRMPNHKMFQRLHRQLWKNSSFIASIGGRGENASQCECQIVNDVYGLYTIAANCVQFWFRRFRSGIPAVETVD
ncbi:hypothetical protein TNCV_1421311 [Trichonephila clavipes]|nr:hypothetical protein TNCV_1421311 [Trichonephila clavipes]